MPVGGARPGAGRKKGSRNKRTKERDAAVQEAAKTIEKALPKAFKGDAHAYLMAVYKDESQPANVRIDAAKAAVRFEKPALASVDFQGNVTMTHEQALRELTEDDAKPAKPAKKAR